MTRRLEHAWIGALTIAFLGGLVAGIPARVASQLLPTEVGASLRDLRGTLWHGRAQIPLTGSEPLALEWTLAPTSLLLASPRLTLVVSHPLGDFHGAAVLQRGSLRLLDGALRTTLSPLAQAAGLPPGTLLGSVDAQGIAATLAVEGILSLVCTGTVSGVTVAGDGTPVALGDLGLSCSDGPAGPTIEISDRGGALALQARVGFAPGWRYLVDGTAGARPGAPVSLAQALPLLGRADGPDRVRFRYSGELRQR